MRPIRFVLSAHVGGHHWRFRPPVYCCAAAATASIATGSYFMLNDRSSKKSEQPWLQVKLPEVAVDAIAGAAGELIQLTVLYPLDTIKVRCQAQSLGTMAVLRQLFANGLNVQVLQQLYAGVLGAAVCSLLVGSVHYVTYSGSKRAAMEALTGGAAGAGAAAGEGDEQSHRRKGRGHQPGAKEEGAVKGEPEGVDMANARSLANLFAAVTSAFMTALVEAPAELFRHNSQAGTIGPNFLAEMWTVLRRDGPLGLYWGFLPYCFESWPYDITELLAYGGLQDWHQEATKEGHVGWFNHSVPEHMRDITFGAVAGTAAVLLSMPFDCIKTYMQTHGMDLGGKGVISSAAVFFQVGQQLVQQHGWSSLFVGVCPRLLQQVPAAMMCWWAIEQTKRSLAPYTETSKTQAQVA